MKRIIGISMIASIFVALFLVGTFMNGWLVTLCIFGGITLLILFIRGAIYLIES